MRQLPEQVAQRETASSAYSTVANADGVIGIQSTIPRIIIVNFYFSVLDTELRMLLPAQPVACISKCISWDSKAVSSAAVK